VGEDSVASSATEGIGGTAAPWLLLRDLILLVEALGCDELEALGCVEDLVDEEEEVTLQSCWREETEGEEQVQEESLAEEVKTGQVGMWSDPEAILLWGAGAEGTVGGMVGRVCLRSPNCKLSEDWGVEGGNRGQ